MDRTLEDATADFVTAARAAVDDLLTPTPCGHESCTERDRLIHAQANKLADNMLDYIQGVEVDPIAAARVLTVVDAVFAIRSIDAGYTKIPAHSLHYALCASIVALHDQAQLK